MLNIQLGHEKNAVQIVAEQDAEAFRQMRKNQREEGRDYNAFIEEVSIREDRYRMPNPRNLTNGATSEILETLNETNNILRRFPTDEQTKQYAVLTKDGIFALREQDGSVKFCENISRYFCGSSASDVYEQSYMVGAALFIAVEFYTKDLIIIASHRYGYSWTIKINLNDGRIAYAPK